MRLFTFVILLSVCVLTFALAIFLLENVSPNDAKRDAGRLSSDHAGSLRPTAWMQALAEEVLPEEVTLWIPAGTFQRSSLVKCPRFPRRYNADETKANPALAYFQVAPVAVGDTLFLNGVRNEQISAQLALASHHDIVSLEVAVSELVSAQGDRISTPAQVRYVGYVPVERGASEYIWSARYEDVAGPEVSGNLSPDLVADVLQPHASVPVPAFCTQPVWFTFRVPRQTPPGLYVGNVAVHANNGKPILVPLAITVEAPILPDVEDYSFNLDVWFNPFAIAQQYGVTPWSDAHLQLLKPYLDDLQGHGVRSVTTTITHQPWLIPWGKEKYRPHTWTGYESMVKWIRTADGNWKFDYTDFDRYVTLAAADTDNFRLHAFSMTVFRGPERITYWDEATGQNTTRYTTVTDPLYRKVWTAFLKDFRQHLLAKKWLDNTWLCFDERPVETLQVVRDIIQHAAPELLSRISLAGSTEFSDDANQLSISFEYFPGEVLEQKDLLSVIGRRNTNRQRTTFYLCGQPAHPNTFSYSPAVEARIIPWLALRYNTSGYLRWAYCDWPPDPLQHPVFYYMQGDDYYVYPGPDGPLSSIRWELLRDGIEDYELTRLAGEYASEEVLQRAVALVTHQTDGRRYNIADLEEARGLLIGSLLKKKQSTPVTFHNNTRHAGKR